MITFKDELASNSYELEKVKDYHWKWIELYEGITMRLFSKTIHDLTREEIYVLRAGISEEQFLIITETFNDFIDEIYHEVDASNHVVSMYKRINSLLETVYIHGYILNSGRKVIQLDYSKFIGNKWNIISKHARGIVYDYHTKEILSLPFHKFFNINEREESKLDSIDLSKPMLVLDKLDGTMIHLMYDDLDETIYFCTRGTIKGQLHNNLASEQFNKQNISVQNVKKLISNGYTPIFELMLESDHEFSHTVDYSDRNLKLTAVRNRENGAYLHPNKVKDIAEKDLNLEVASCHKNKSLFSVLNEKKAVKNHEGWVLVNELGQFFKVKTDDYMGLIGGEVAISDLEKDSISLKRIVLEWMFQDIADDMIASLPSDGMRHDANLTLDEISLAVQRLLADMKSLVHSHYSDDPKQFALNVIQSEDIDKASHSIIFKLKQGKPVDLKYIHPNLIEKYL